MKIYTKTGDRGETGLFGGKRLSKSDLRVQAYGEVDELQAVLGLARAQSLAKKGLSKALGSLQSDCFILSAELARAETKTTRKDPVLTEGEVESLEKQIDHLETKLPVLKNFVLQGGSELAARLYLARAVCRRAERAVVGLAKKEPVSPVILRYLNRLSDLLFVYARFANQEDGVTEEEWRP